MFFSDFEAILSPVTDDGSKTHKHLPICYAWLLTSTIEIADKMDPKVYTGLDCAKVFVEEMVQLYDQSLSHYFNMNVPLTMTKQDQVDFQNTTSCHICGREFTDLIVKAKDHSHINGN